MTATTRVYAGATSRGFGLPSGRDQPKQEATETASSVDYVFHNTATDVITHQGRVLPGRASFVLEVKRHGISSTCVLLRDEEVDTLFAGKPFPEEAQIEALLATLPPERFT